MAIGEKRSWAWVGLALVLALAIGAGDGAWAQTNTGAIRGVVRDAGGAVPLVKIIAVNEQTGFRYENLAREDGNYLLSGLAPGSYRVEAQMDAYHPTVRTVQVLVGQTAALDFTLRLMTTVAETVEVTVAPAETVDMRSSEVGTNVSAAQIEGLPQNSRNFINFAALAPGVRVADDQNATQKFSSGAQNSRQVNVFIDGLSYKNDVLVGGAFMQDSSKGNPFPQNAIQEFRVITQNNKAEYEKASAAVITAVTKSGGNLWKGDALLLFQNKSMVALDEFAEKRGDAKPDYKRYQTGISVGGPLIKDKLHLFVSFERNDQNRYNSVFFGPSTIPETLKAKFEPYKSQMGNVLSPFKSNLFFGKLSYQPSVGQNLDFSASMRDESEERGFGGQRVKEGAEDFRIKTSSAVLKHQFILGNSLNEAIASWQRMEWNPTALNPSTPHQNYFGILDIGGKDSSQDFQQDRIGLRDDFTFPVTWNGSHSLKTGISLNFMKYDVSKSFNANPIFNYRQDESWAFPFEAFYGYGDPRLKFSNNQYGLYLQDDWRPTPKIEVSVGLRWDYESNMVNNTWTTPDYVVTALQNAKRTYGDTTVYLRDILDLGRFTTDGSRRDPYYGMVQPRLGFSYDISGDATTVVYGAWGKYFDRVQLNDIFDEKFRLSWKTYKFCFSADGLPRNDCQSPIKWQDSYLSAAGLAQLIASGQAPGPELFLVDNNLHPPRSDQWSLGVRQRLANWLVGLSYNGVRGYNGMSWFFADLPANTAFNDRWGNNVPIAGYGRAFKALAVRKLWYDAAYLTIDRPYKDGWAFNLAYTYARADQTGGSNPYEGVDFSLDFVSPQDLKRVPADNDERQRVVMSGMIDLPLEFRLSSVITLGTGNPYTVYDASQGWDKFTIRWNAGRPEGEGFLGIGRWAYRSVDLRLDKTFEVGIGRLGFSLEGFNILNYANYGCFESTQTPEGNARFGQPNCAFNPRRLQAGVNFSF